ncbi:hypothetical protein P9027_32285 [Bacillus thuringiensis]|uniref:hypothetical protein n=1 Tax=Bacillus thuringiensis TaxID=1428 RepID=UPI002DB7BC4E|nr:hypothetical protein [Bacillus thuringiensis]MEC3226582.1 hypothetical protein [Bacillus thuringiensis]MEC3461695.1 hypothetical protein [Bacillus thuringiensis]MEC3553395.1 hypothetical protein [Bacillus thuringiensis]
MVDIEKLMGYSTEEFSLLNFQDSKYINERNGRKKEPSILRIPHITLETEGITKSTT